MAQCKLTPREFISNTFSPQIGAVCSSAAESVCQRNNLSFIELLQPFSNLNSEGHIKDPQGTSIVVRNLHLSILDINSQPPEPTTARKLLNDSVSIEQCDRTTNLKITNTKIDIPISVPWFESWREMFLNVQFPSDHEFTKHFIACMIVVSTSDENPIEKIQEIAVKLSQISSTKLPKWFNNNTLRYYILIYDSSQDDKLKAEKVFGEMKNIYDTNNCYFLSMNSRPIDLSHNSAHLPDPWCQFLIKQTDNIILSSSETNSSPRTPADTGCVSSMPNQVSSSGPDKTSQAGTPIISHNPIMSSPTDPDSISLTSELADVPNTPINVEMGQEAVPVIIHPLSPTTETEKKIPNHQTTNDIKNQINPINENVWADSPTREVQSHGALLSTQDLERIRSLITEFCIKSLLPYVERQISILNDVISNKKGVSRSLFSATKRWFGTSKPGAPNSAPSNAVIYSTDSPELQLRRLGDLCFMFGHYSLAYQAYHSAKRDFQADQAWLYYAGALEMAGLSAFMQGESDRKTIQYLDDAILTYSNTCKMPQFAVRATLLSSECLKGRGLYTDAAKQLIRMTSEDSDLRSALLLEQASYCFIFPKMIHKYAFHMVLAGHRYSKAGQKKHSLRCYQQAYQIYQDKGWSLAEDHIHYTIGRQAASLKQISEAVKAFEKLLNPLSKQPPAQQAAFLREYLQIQNLVTQNSISNNDGIIGIPNLPLPLVNDNSIKIYCGNIGDDLPFDSENGGDGDDDDDENKWWKLEEILVTEAQGSAPMIFKPTIAIYSDKSNNTTGPIGIVDEPIYFSIELYNPLSISIPLSKIKLIWTFNKDNQVLTNETETENSLAESSCIVESSTIDAILLQSKSRERIVLSVVPSTIGELNVIGISYNLTNIISPTIDGGNTQGTIIVHGKKLFNIRGPKLQNIKDNNDDSVCYGIDKRLELNIVDKSPYLYLKFTKLTKQMICGEIQKINVTLKNTGNSGLKNLLISSTNPKLFCIENLYINNNNIKSNLITKINIDDCLEPGKEINISFWIRAPHKKGNHKLDLLFYYENIDKNSIPKYRLRRQSWMLTVFDSVQIKAITRQSIVSNNNNTPTLNLILQIKNSNQIHDSLLNDISLTKVSLKSNNWKFGDKIFNKISSNIQPQETCHLFFKVERRRIDENILNDISDVSLIENDNETLLKTPFVDFVERKNISPLKYGDTDGGSSAVYGKIDGNLEDNSDDKINMKLNMTLILRWKARIMEGKSKVFVREAVGQHHVDLMMLNHMYKHPEDVLPEPSDYPTRLIIFGPERNVPDTNVIVKKESIVNNQVPNNIVTFSLEHEKNIIHDFDKRKICVVPVTMHVQNHSKIKLEIKVNTIGTSSQTFLPSIKSQLYSPKASTFFRYVCHTAINCKVEPLERDTVKLQAVVSTAGTYDFASRIEISARAIDTHEFITQKWKIESVCSVSDENI